MNEYCTYCGTALEHRKTQKIWICPFCGQVYGENDMEYINYIKQDR